MGCQGRELRFGKRLPWLKIVSEGLQPLDGRNIGIVIRHAADCTAVALSVNQITEILLQRLFL